MMQHHPLRRALSLVCLLGLLAALSACGGQESPSASQEQDETLSSAEEASGTQTLESLCGEDYQTYLTETITMQMGNRMDKDPDVVYFPIQEGKPLTDYVAIDETTDFTVDEDGNIVISFPAGSVTDAAHGEQSFRVPCA